MVLFVGIERQNLLCSLLFLGAGAGVWPWISEMNTVARTAKVKATLKVVEVMVLLSLMICY